jgi:hypothetical protein
MSVQRLYLLTSFLLLIGMACNFSHLGAMPTQDARSTPEVVEPARTPTTPPTIIETPPETRTLLPDTKDLTVVYTRDGDLWRWQGGELLQLTRRGEVYFPRLSPDGQIAAFLRPADSFHVELWAVNIDGSDERRLVGIADLDTIGGGARDPNATAVNPSPSFAWVGQSHRLAFTTYQAFQGPGVSPLNDLNLVDADSGQIVPLLLSGWGGEFVFSPDGQQIAISQPDKIILADANGDNYRIAMTYSPVLTYSEYRYYARPVWSPDGKFLRVAVPPADPLARPAQPTTLWKLPLDGGQAVQEGSIFSVPFMDEPLYYSPDLQRVALIRESIQDGVTLRELHLAAYDGNGDWNYVRGPMLHFAGWSPDGRRFIYILGEEQEMFLGSLDRAPQPLGELHYGLINLRWIDDQRLLYAIQRNQAFDLVLLDLDDGALTLDTIAGAPPGYDFFRR